MAKWGEGDPRWIVEERPDAVNVNNWHWTEKNACSWSKDRFEKLFTNLEIKGNIFKCIITKIEKCTGEAVVINRKGKLIFLYEWDITMRWKGKLQDTENYENGKILISNLSEENDVHEIDINISADEGSVTGNALKIVMDKPVADKIRELLSKYIQSLKAEFSQGVILPSKGSSEDTECKENINHTVTKSKISVNSNPIGPAKSETKVEPSGNTSTAATVEIRQLFCCSAPELYNALTISENVAAFTRGLVSLDLRPGGKFELFDGNVSGEFIELVPDSKIVKTWRCKRWPAGHYSRVVIEIMEEQHCTELKLTQTNVPQDECEGIQENWKRYYLDPIQSTFGYNYFMKF